MTDEKSPPRTGIAHTDFFPFFFRLNARRLGRFFLTGCGAHVCARARVFVYAQSTTTRQIFEKNNANMPPASKTSSKRKTVDDSEVAADDSTKQARVDNEPKSDVEMTPEDIAKQMFASNASKPCPEVKHSSGGAGSVTMEGIVVSSKKISVQEKGVTKPKLAVNIHVLKVNASSGGHVIQTNIDGIVFGLPTKQLEASPEEVAKDANAKGPIVIEIEDANSKTNYLGNISASFYTDSKSKDKSDTASVESCVPGMKVLVSGVSCSFGKTGTGRLYTNAKKIAPLQAPLEIGMAPQSVISQLCTASAQQSSSFLLSSTVGGFFDVTYSEPHLAEQADVFKEKWTGFTDTAAAKCDLLAAIYSSTSPEVSAALSAHGTRLREVSGEDAAQGAHLFNVELQKDALTPYIAPLVQKGVTPGSNIYGMASDMFDAKKRDLLPPSFVDAKVVGLQFRGNLCQVDYRLSFVGNRDSAIAMIKEGKNPFLQFDNATTSLKLSLRSAGPEGIGTLVKTKIEMGLNEIVPVMDHAALISVYPRSSTSSTVDGHFASTVGFNYVDGINKVGIAISKAYLDKNMLGGRGVFIFNPVDDVEQVEALQGIAPQPTLSKNLYQAVSESSFDFDSLVAPDGKEVKFCVVYSGCSHNVAQKPSLATNVEDGEAHINDIVSSTRDDGDIKKFLKENSLVYAVAV